MTCEFWIEKDGKKFKCEEENYGVIRRHDCCYTHYCLLRRDNKKRMVKTKDIPDTFETIIKVGKIATNLCKKEIKNPIKRPVAVDEDDGIGVFEVECDMEELE